MSAGSEAHGHVGDKARRSAALADGLDLVFVGDVFPGELRGPAVAAGLPVVADDGVEHGLRGQVEPRVVGDFGFLAGVVEAAADPEALIARVLEAVARPEIAMVSEAPNLDEQGTDEPGGKACLP